MTLNKGIALAGSIVLVALAAPNVLAQGTHFKLYGGPSYIAPLSESDISVGSVTDAAKAEQHVGWNFGVEGRLGKLIGLELDYVRATQDVSFAGQTIGQTDFSPLSASVNFHLVHTTIVDFYFGPSYTYVNWGDIELNSAGQGLFGTTGLGTDSESAWGVGLGLDVGLGKHLALTGGLRYIDTEIPSQSGQPVSVDPLVARLGLAVRF